MKLLKKYFYIRKKFITDESIDHMVNMIINNELLNKFCYGLVNSLNKNSLLEHRIIWF